MIPALASFAARRPRLLLVAYCLLCWLPGFATLPATDRDEARFAQGTRQMLESGDFVDIRNGVEARNRKPIGIYWLQAPGVAAARALGIATENPIWPYRLPSLAGGLVAVLATFGIGRRLFGEREALLGAAMLGGSLLLVAETGIAKTDAALLGVTTLAMATLARAYLDRRLDRWQAALFWLATGAGVLLKGPITPMVEVLAAVALVAADRRAGWLAALRWRWGAPLLLAVALPWFVAIGIATHGAFFHDAVGGDLAGKLAGGDDSHGPPPGFHLLALSLGLFPVGFAVLRALPQSWVRRREPATRFLLAWAVPSWLVFEAVPTKLIHYPLPLYPALCLLGARWALDPARRTPRWLAVASAALFLAAALLLGGAGAALPFELQMPSFVILLGLPAALAVGLIAGLVMAAGRDMPRAVVAGLVCMPLLSWAMRDLELPRLAPLWIGPRVAAALRAHPAPGGFAVSGYAEPSLMFAVGTGTRFLDPSAAAAFLAARPGRVVAVDASTLPAFHAALGGAAAQAFATVAGVNYANGHRVSLTLFGP